MRSCEICPSRMNESSLPRHALTAIVVWLHHISPLFPQYGRKGDDTLNSQITGSGLLSHVAPHENHRCAVPTSNSCTRCLGSLAWYTTARLIATQFLQHGYLDDLTTERIFNPQATWFISVLGLFFDMLSSIFSQPDTSRRPVDWCRN